MGNFGVDDDFEMTRVKLEELIMDKIKTSMQITEGAIRSGNLTVEQIDEVLLCSFHCFFAANSKHFKGFACRR